MTSEQKQRALRSIHAFARAVSAPRLWCAGALLFFALAWGCSSSTVDGGTQPAECEGDERRACSLEGCGGLQRCDGGSWGDCECVSSAVGRACERAADCERDEVCFDADYLGGELPGGICTLRCDEDPAACERRDPPSVCVVTAEEGAGRDGGDAEAHCLPQCELGEADGDKCYGRENMACAEVSADADDATTSSLRRAADVGDGSLAVCRPLCSADAQCGSGECDPRTGACVSSVNEFLFGGECDPDEDATTQCAGVCVEVDGVGFCSQRCRLGSLGDCGASGGSDARGLCRFPEREHGAVGDVGFCSLLCDCDTDCGHAEMQCEPFASSTLEALTGALGVCTPSNGTTARVACNPDDPAAADAGAIDAGSPEGGLADSPPLDAGGPIDEAGDAASIE